jgi:hypothetical protein
MSLKTNIDKNNVFYEVRKIVRQTLLEVTKKKSDQEIHLPELTMKKKDLVKYLKDVYNIELK